MDKRQLASLVHKSVARGEDLEDFEWMVNALIDMEDGPNFIRGRTRRRFKPISAGGSLDVANRAWFLCLLVKPKPPAYKAAMHQFRLALAGVSTDERLREVFRASIRDRLLRSSLAQGTQVLRPSLYFDLEKALKRARMLGVNIDEPKDWY
jgi:hypothetical protein